MVVCIGALLRLLFISKGVLFNEPLQRSVGRRIFLTFNLHSPGGYLIKPPVEPVDPGAGLDHLVVETPADHLVLSYHKRGRSAPRNQILRLACRLDAKGSP